MKPQNTLEVMARLGHGARGLVYCIVGGLALLAAIGSGGQTGGTRSALQTLLGQPFGRVLLVAIALGFAFLATWRVLEPITDADHRGAAWKGLAVRAVHLGSSFIYVGLALSTLGLAFGWGGGGGGDDRGAKDWTAWLMAQPFGPWLVGLVGFGVAAAGIAHLLRGWRGNVTRGLKCSEEVSRWAIPMGRIGFGARGIVFLLIGGFLILAALHSRASEARGLGGALRALQAQPYGWALLGVTAAGLLAFGLFGFVEAFYRRIDAPDLDETKDAVEHGVRGLGSRTG
jgi:hypothetical protein